MEKTLIWQKTKQNSYMLSEYSDASMFTLDFFLGDGLEPKHYINFLDNKNEITLSCNVSSMQKHNGMVTVTLYDSDLLNLPDFTTTIDNLLKILKEWYYYQDHLVDVIKISLVGNDLTVLGTQKDKIIYNNQKIIFILPADSTRYGLVSCQGETSYLLAHFLSDLLLENIQHYIEWACNPNGNQVTRNFSTLEKKDAFILIGSKLTEKEEDRPVFKISTEQFVDLLKRWKKLGEEKLQELVITQEDSKINITGN